MTFTFFKSIVEIEASMSPATQDLIVDTLNNKHTLTCVLDEHTCTAHAFLCLQAVALLCNKKEIHSITRLPVIGSAAQLGGIDKVLRTSDLTYLKKIMI